VVAAADGSTELSSDAAVQQLCTAVSTDDVTTCQRDKLSTSRAVESTAAACMTDAAPTVNVASHSLQDAAAVFSSTAEESDSRDVLEIRQQAAAGSKSLWYTTAGPPSSVLHNTTTLGNPSMSENTVVSGNCGMSAGETVSVREYCEVFEQWAWQYYWWMMHVHWMTWAAYMSLPMYTTMSCIPSSAASTQSAMPAATRPIGLQQQQQLPVHRPQIPQPVRGNMWLPCNVIF